MIKLTMKSNVDGDKEFHYEFSGLSSDSKPTTWGEQDIEDNSLFLELDTGKFYYLTEGEWAEIGTSPTPSGTLLLDKTIDDLQEYPGTGIYMESSTSEIGLPDDITVVWDGVSYSCTIDGQTTTYGAAVDFDQMTADFSTYPFCIAPTNSIRTAFYVATDDDNEHTIKIYGEVE